MKQAYVLDAPPAKAGANKTAAKMDSPVKAGRNAKAAVQAKPLTLSGLIRSKLDGCSRAQRDVALYIIDHLEESAFQTAEQLAAQV
ncbi:MAG: hypothetical protein JJE27_07880, partial [Thermoleophilia bacterium]|nr:hypothetical protein [Thermoleophilia bacterium]